MNGARPLRSLAPRCPESQQHHRVRVTAPGAGAREAEHDARRPVSVRFIELMPTGCDAEFFASHHLPIAWVATELERRGWTARERAPTDGPAIEYGHPGHAGRVGYIAPSSEGFCDTCNRLRVSSRGALKLCLFGDGDVSLRRFLASDAAAETLPVEIARLVLEKPRAHRLAAGCNGGTRSLAVIGG